MFTESVVSTVPAPDLSTNRHLFTQNFLGNQKNVRVNTPLFF